MDAGEGVGAGSLHAWVDESMRHGHPGGYILAAVICDPAGCDPIRDHLRQLLLRGQQRLHWRDEKERRRSLIASEVASLEIAAAVVVGMPLAPSKQERAKRICMETLLPQLQAAGVGQVWLEARNDRLNQNDRAMVEAMRGQRLLRTEFRVDVARPLDEPMLWVSDVVAGAVKARWDGRPDWFGVMQHRVPEYLIALR